MYTIKQIPEDFKVDEIYEFNNAEGNFIYFILRKKNYTTIRALQHIAQALKVNIRLFSFAGNKDKQAITSQLVSARNISARKLSQLGLRDIEIEILGTGDVPIVLGSLLGNNFEIHVKNISPQEFKIFDDKLMQKIILPNYFGEQRFSKNNHHIGKCIVSGDFEKACELLLLDSGDDEQKLKKHLKQNSSDYIGALRLIHKRILSMYVHAYQSYIWNKTVKTMLENKTYDKNVLVPIVGFGSHLSKDDVSKIISNILYTEKINLRDFILRKIPELSSEGYSRKSFIIVNDLKVMERGSDFVKISYSLPKGSYATVVIKWLFTTSFF